MGAGSVRSGTIGRVVFGVSFEVDGLPVPKVRSAGVLTAPGLVVGSAGVFMFPTRLEALSGAR